MNTSPVLRIIDANLNRLAEGLRVMEEAARMILDDAGLTARLKTLRHDLIRGDTAFNLELLNARDSADDVGMDLKVSGENPCKDLPTIIVANARRAQESLRVLEDLAKLPEMIGTLDFDRFKQARFELYTLEQQLVQRLTRQERQKKIKGLYVILDTQVLNGRSHLEAAEKVIQAGVKVLQLRDKTTPRKQIIELAGDLQALCRKHEVLFIINDYLDVALAMNADGLHIGQEDLPVAEARRLLAPDKVLGCSADTPAEAQTAEREGADYIAVGAIFPTGSKNDVDVVGTERLRTVKPFVKAPLAAIGGINKNNALEALMAGADSLCVISAVLLAPDITLAARQIIEIIEAKK
jgi:thiamine-phosphate pyrophosphorylase